MIERRLEATGLETVSVGSGIDILGDPVLVTTLSFLAMTPFLRNWLLSRSLEPARHFVYFS